jgi:hypothetical protein
MAIHLSRQVPNSRRRYRVGPTMVEKSGWLDPLSSWSIVAFAALAILWFVFRTLPEPAPRWFRAHSRLCAYGAAGLMLVPYLHILRRAFRYRHWGRTATWMRWHILAAYLGFGLAIIHSRARSNNELTLAIQVALWAVIVSGVIGFYGQKLVYRIMSLIVDEEVGLERLGPEREQLIERAVKLGATLPVLEAEDVRDWPGLRDRLGVLCGAWNTELTPPAVTSPSQPEPQASSEPDPRQALRDAVNSVLRALAPQKRPDPEKEKDTILNAVNRLMREEGFFGLNNPGGLTPPRWLEGVFSKSPASRATVEATVSNHWLLGELMTRDVLLPAAARTDAVAGFFERVLSESLRPALAPWGWLFSGRAHTPIPENHYLRAHKMCGTAQREKLEEVWGLVEIRRQLDVEAWLHRLGRTWLLIHGPASWALLLLVLVHVWLSVRYGGY